MEIINNLSHIDVSLLKSGDVILSSDSLSKYSKKIEAITFGKYSHAVIVINSLLFFEATPIGVGFFRPYISKVERTNHKEALLWDISNYKNIDVFRHKNIGQEDLANKLINILSSQRGKEYPNLTRLNNANTFFKRISFISSALLMIIDYYIGNKKKNNPGMFCSELVSYCLNKVGYPPFHIEKHDSEVSPNDFSNGEISNLNYVNDVKTVSNNNLNDSISYRKVLNMSLGMGNNINSTIEEVEMHVLLKLYLDRVASITNATIQSFDEFTKEQAIEIEKTKRRDVNINFFVNLRSAISQVRHKKLYKREKEEMDEKARLESMILNRDMNDSIKYKFMIKLHEIYDFSEKNKDNY